MSSLQLGTFFLSPIVRMAKVQSFRFSRHHIPAVFQSLMTDNDSPIIDFYPESFEIDMNGKKMLWQGVALLPFIDRHRLLEAINPRFELMTEVERERSKLGQDNLFVSEEHPLYDYFSGLYTKRRPQEVSLHLRVLSL